MPAASTLASVFLALIAALITLISCLPATQQPETGRRSSQKVLGDEFPGSPGEGEAVLTGGPWGCGGAFGQRGQVGAGGEGWGQGVQKASLQLFEEAQPPPTEALESAPPANLLLTPSLGPQHPPPFLLCHSLVLVTTDRVTSRAPVPSSVASSVHLSILTVLSPAHSMEHGPHEYLVRPGLEDKWTSLYQGLWGQSWERV